MRISFYILFLWFFNALHNFKQFTNKDGYLKGGVEVKVPEEIPTKNKVGGQRRMLKDKKSEVSWW